MNLNLSNLTVKVLRRDKNKTNTDETTSNTQEDVPESTPESKPDNTSDQKETSNETTKKTTEKDTKESKPKSESTTNIPVSDLSAKIDEAKEGHNTEVITMFNGVLSVAKSADSIPKTEKDQLANDIDNAYQKGLIPEKLHTRYKTILDTIKAEDTTKTNPEEDSNVNIDDGTVFT